MDVRAGAADAANSTRHPEAELRPSMRTLPNTFQNSTRSVFIVLAAAALLFTTGCSVFYQEDDGDKEPELGYYRVNVESFGQNVQLDPKADKILLPVSVSATCLGEKLPPNCDADPNWRGIGGAGVNVTVENPHQRSTKGTIEVDVPSILFLQQYYLTANRVRIEAQFIPNVPRGMKLSGNWTYAFHLILPSPAAERKEEPADDPRLEAWPEKLTLFPSVALPNPARIVEIFYNGPETTLLTPEIDGPGRTKWLVSVPPTVLRGDGRGPTATIQYIGPRGGSDLAYVIFQTRGEKSAVASITLTTP
jgi:hypothetical protein